MCGRDSPKPNTGNNEDGTGATTGPSTGPRCDRDNFNATGCNITIAGKLLVVLDTINKTLQSHFECFREVIASRLNDTNVKVEKHNNTNMTELRLKMDALRKDYGSQGTNESEAGMALILSDKENNSKEFDYLDSTQEPYIYFINVGQGTNERNSSCYRRYEYIQRETELPNVGRELESTACDPYSEHMEKLCSNRLTTPSHTLSPPSSSGPADLSIVIPSVVGAFIVAVVLVLCIICSPKCKRKGKAKRDTMVEYSLADNRLRKQTMSTDLSKHYSSPRETNELYNALWEKEKNGNTDEKQENYQHLDMHFVKKETYSSLYDHVIKGGDDLDDVFEPPS